jgi:hypothetical protein
MADDLSDIPAATIAQWERLGVDLIEADLKGTGLRYVGGVDVQAQAWRWVTSKRTAQQKSIRRKETIRFWFIAICGFVAAVAAGIAAVPVLQSWLR